MGKIPFFWPLSSETLVTPNCSSSLSAFKHFTPKLGVPKAWVMLHTESPFPMGTSLSYPIGHVLEVEAGPPPRHFNSYQLSHANSQGRTPRVISPPTHAILLLWA